MQSGTMTTAPCSSLAQAACWNSPVDLSSPELNQELPLISKFLVLASIVPHNNSSLAITTKTSAVPTEMLRPF